MILGVDFSLTGTGLAVIGPDEVVDTCTIRTWTDNGTVRSFAERIEHIADSVEAWADLGSGDTIVMEDLLHHAPSAHRGRISGGWWVVASRIARAVDDPVILVPPKTRAKYATGTGAAKKQAVFEQARARYPRFEIRNDNEADAVVLAAIGARLTGRPIDPDIPDTNLAAIRRYA